MSSQRWWRWPIERFQSVGAFCVVLRHGDSVFVIQFLSCTYELSDCVLASRLFRERKSLIGNAISRCARVFIGTFENAKVAIASEIPYPLEHLISVLLCGCLHINVMNRQLFVFLNVSIRFHEHHFADGEVSRVGNTTVIKK